MTQGVRTHRSREDGHQRRQRILDEAQHLIGERGYHGFGIQELAARCGLTKPGLLHHFGSKDQLLTTLLRDRDAQHEQGLGLLLAEDFGQAGNAERRRSLFMESLHRVIAHNASQPGLVRLQTVLRVEAINPDHPAHAYFEAREVAKLSVIADRLATFMPDPVATARQLVAIITGLEEQWLRANGQFDLVAQCDRAIAKLLPESG